MFDLIDGFMPESSNLRDTSISRNKTLKSHDFHFGSGDFEIRFKCMSGFTTENAKFIMPLQNKMSYDDSFDSCDSFGFTNQFYVVPLKLINYQKLYESLKKTWTTDSSCSRRK